MGSLTNCAKEIGLEERFVTRLRKQAEQYRADGESAQDAMVMAAEAWRDGLKEELSFFQPEPTTTAAKGETKAEDLGTMSADDIDSILDSIPTTVAKEVKKPKKKKAKVEVTDETEREVYNQISYGKKKLSSRSAVELKEMAGKVGIPKSQKKADLVEQLQAWFNQQQLNKVPSPPEPGLVTFAVDRYVSESTASRTVVEPIFAKANTPEEKQRIKDWKDTIGTIANYFGGTKISKKPYMDDYGQDVIGKTAAGYHFGTNDKNGGLEAFIEYMSQGKKPILPTPEQIRKGEGDGPVEFKGEKEKDAAELAKKAAKKGISMADNTLKGLSELFGGKNKLSSGITIDPDKYAKAKPYFQAALKDAVEAGQTIKELFELLIDQFGDGIRDYLKQFAMDLREEEAKKDVLSDVPLQPGEKVVVSDEELPEGTTGTIISSELDIDGETLLHEIEYTIDDPDVGEFTETAFFFEDKVKRFGNVKSTTEKQAGTSERVGTEEPDTAGTTEAGTGRPEQQAVDTSGKAEEGGPRAKSDSGVPGDRTLTSSEQGSLDLLEQSGEFGPETGTASDRDGKGGVDNRPEGLQPEQNRSKEAEDLAAETAKRVKAQKKFATGEHDIHLGDPVNIEHTLPILFSEQQEDVAFVEKRLFTEDKRGVMLTNGTGTGKTYSGLGVIQRFLMNGNDNILIVVPNDGVADGWIGAGKDFGMKISAIKTKGAGKGVTVITYSSLYQNFDLVNRDWDLIVHDEAQTLSSGAQGKPTKFLNMSRAITGHPKGMLTYAETKEADLLAEIATIKNKIEEAKLPAQKDKLKKQYGEKLDTWNERREEHYANRRRLWEGKRDTGLPRTYRLDLSATPFSHVFSIDLAEGFLFDYPGETAGRYGQIDGRGVFLMEHFGYRIRNNKLTAPEAEVDNAIMERQFNTWLKQEGALSGRQLSIDQDYSREFVEIDNMVGNLIDEGFELISERGRGKGELAEGYRQMEEVIRQQFKYADRIKLLEAIKAPHAVKRAKKHLELGRQVVIFHSYNVGGTVHPFKILAGKAALLGEPGPYELALQELQSDRPDLFNMDINLQRPLDLFAQEFGDAVRFFGGEEKNKKKRLANMKAFNQDNNDVRVLVVQEDAGGAGLSLHDTTGKHPRALINIGLPVKPVTSIQEEGRIYRVGQKTNAVFEYFTTGTSFERWTFAGKVAERADTVENLSHGEEGRNLKEAFINAYEIPIADEPGLHQGLGGKEADAAVWEVISEFERAISDYYTTQKVNDKRDQRDGTEYYATPEPLGLKMVEWANLRSGDHVLEPSAGHGAISRYFPENASAIAVDNSSKLLSRAALRNTGGTKFKTMDFEDLDVGGNKFNAIVMNPPYGSGNALGIQHLRKAMHHLKNGGRIVALIPEGPAADKKLDQLLYGKENELEDVRKKLREKRKKGESVAEEQKRIDELINFHLVADIGLPRVTFERAGTSVKPHIVIIDKYEHPNDVPQSQGRSDIEADKVKDLFDQIEDFSVIPRNEVSKTAEEILADFGMQVVQIGKEYHLDGKTFEYRDIIGPVVRAHEGGNWDRRFKVWTANEDFTVPLSKALEGKEWREPEEKPIDWRPMWEVPEDQEWHSTHASINRVKNPVTIGLVEKHYGGWESGTKNADIGGGMHDNTIEYLKQKGVDNFIYDPFNRTPEYNANAVQNIKDGQADTATINNTLNVIKEEDIRNKVLREAANALKPGGTVYIQIYEGDGNGIGRHTKGDIWQEHRKTADYLDEVKRVFPDAEIKYGLITAKNTIIAHKADASQLFDKGRDSKLSSQGPGATLSKNGLIVTETTTKNGTPVWEVSGNTMEHKDLIKSLGGRWYRPKKIWSFYNHDPSSELAEALDKPSYSKRKFGGVSGKSKYDIRTELKNSDAGTAASFLIESGSLVIVQGEEDLPDRLVDELGGIKGVFDPKTGKSFLVADNIFEDAYGTFLHEVGVHYGIEQVLGTAKLKEVLSQMKRAEAAGNKAVMNARAQVPHDVPAHRKDVETLAYLVENESNWNMSLIKKIFAAIRKFLRETFGDTWAGKKLGLNNVTQYDLVQVAKGAIDAAVNRKTNYGHTRNIVPNDHLEAPFFNRPKFKQWFGKTKMVDDKGVPIVYYHGTPYGEIKAFNLVREKVEGLDNDKYRQVGYYFTTDPGYATAYAKRGPQWTGQDSSEVAPTLYPVYIRIEKPYIMHGKESLFDRLRESVGLESKRPSIAGSAYVTQQEMDKLIEAGYDGIINQASSEVIAFDGNQVKSAIGNDGNYSRADDDISHSQKQIYKSKFLDIAIARLHKNGTGQTYRRQFAHWIDPKRGMLSKGEYDWIGLDEFFESNLNQKLSKADVIDFIRENMPVIEDRVIGEPKFTKEVMPGPVEGHVELTMNIYADRNKTMNEVFQTPEAHGYGRLDADIDRIVHIRATERYDVRGRRTLVIEELQNDWVGTGDFQGYQSELDAITEKDVLKKWNIEQGPNGRYYFSTGSGNYVRAISRPYDTREQLIEYGRRRILAEQKGNDTGVANPVPDFPFQTKWLMLGFKRALRYAVENGYDRVAWQATPEAVALTQGWNDLRLEDGKYIMGLDHDVTSVVERTTKSLRNRAHKYVKKWNATVGKTKISLEDYDGDNKLWLLDIEDPTAPIDAEQDVRVISARTMETIKEFNNIDEAEQWVDENMPLTASLNMVEITPELREASLQPISYSRVSENDRMKPDTTTAPKLVNIPSSVKERIDNSSSWVAKVARRWFTKEGLLGDIAFNEFVMAESEKKSGEETAGHMIYDFEKAVKKTYSVPYRLLSQENMEKLNEFLAGNTDVDIPVDMVESLTAMRALLDNHSKYIFGAIADLIQIQVDGLSEKKQQDYYDYLNSGGREGKLPPNVADAMVLLDTIANNQGQYLHRSYRAFDDPKWKDLVGKNEDLMARARIYIQERNQDLTPDEVDGAISALLQGALDQQDFVSLLTAGVKYGTKDISILKKRKDLDPIILELLGEYKDPRLNFARSIGKMQWYVANHHFLMNLRQKGLGLFLFKKPNKFNGFDVQVAPPGSSKLNPLDGLWTSKDFETGLMDAMDLYTGGAIYGAFVKGNSWIKYGKTVLSPTTMFRNFWSGSFFPVLNGHFSTHMIDDLKWASGSSWADLMTHEEKYRGYLKKLLDLGVLHDSPRSEELRLALKDAVNDLNKLDKYTARSRDWFMTFLEVMQKLYRLGDDFWKIYGFESEKRSWMETGMSESQAEKKAAERIRNGYPTYSMVPKSMKWLRRNIFFGAFVSFPWEIARTAFNQGKFLQEDIRGGRTKAVAKRLIGMSITSSLAYAGSILSMAMMGIDDEDDEAIRSLLPDWSRNSQLVYLGYDKNGMPMFWDASHLDPYTYIKKPVSALMNGNNEGFDDKLKDASMEALGSFVGFDIGFNTVFELVTNKNSSGGHIYNLQDEDFGWDMWEHFRKGVQPGMAGNVERTSLAALGKVSKSGKEYKLTEEAAAWIGYRGGTLNLNKSIGYKGVGFMFNKRDAKGILSRRLGTREALSESDVRRAIGSTVHAWEETYSDMIGMIRGARTLGMSDSELREVLIARGVSKKDSAYLVKGEIPKIKITAGFIKNAEKAAISSAKNRIDKLRIRREMGVRRHLVRKILTDYYRTGEL